MGGVMDFEAFQNLPAAEGDTKTSFDKLMNVYREIDRIECLYYGHSVYPETTLQRQIQAWFDGLSNDQKADPLQPARGYLSNLKEHQLEPLEANSGILEDILNKMNVEIQAKKWLRPAMSSLLNKSTQNLQTIQGALSSLKAEQFDTFLNNFDKMASRIAGQNRNRLTDTYKILMDKLAEHDGNANITVRLNAAYDEVAQKCQNLNPLQRGLSVLKGLFSREPSLQTLPQTLVNPFASESPTAGEALADTVDGAENQQSTPATAAAPAPAASTPSRPRNIPLRIASTAILGTMGLFGLAGLVSLIKQGFRPTAPAAAPAVDLAELSNGTPRINVALETIENDFKKTEPGWMSLETYLGETNVHIIDGNPKNNAAIERALITLKEKMAKGGMASSDGAVQDATRESIEKIAELTGINKKEFVNAYTNARDAVNGKVLNGQRVTDDIHTPAVHHEKMGKALDALSAKITQSRASSRASVDDRVWFSVGHGGGGGDGTLIASGPVSDVSSGFLPVQHASPIQSFLSHTRETMSAAMQNVGEAAQHASHAIKQVVTSEPVQAALHNSATYTAVSLAVTATSVRFQAVREARQAEKTDGPKLNFAANARGLARDFFTKDVGGPAAYQAQLNKATTKVALGRAAFAAICPPVAIAATAMGVTAFGAGVVHHVTKDNPKLARVAAASEYLAKMEYVNQATGGMARGFTAAKTFATQAASSPLVTQAMDVTQTTMQTASNAFESAKERTATMFASLFNRQATAAL